MEVVRLARFFKCCEKELMITVMKDIPPHVAGFIASGEVTKSDYENVLIPRVEEVYKTHIRVIIPGSGICIK
jgi:hypothetical protein